MTRFKDVMPKGTRPHNLKLERPMPPTLLEVGNQEVNGAVMQVDNNTPNMIMFLWYSYFFLKISYLSIYIYFFGRV